MCGLLFNQFHYIIHSFRGVITYQEVYMVFVSFHSYNTISFRIADLVYLLFDIVSDRALKYLLAVLGYKNNVHL